MRSADFSPFVVTVSGSDASGGAGLQADNRAIQSLGAFPLNVVTALTLQTDRGVQSVDPTPPELVRMHLLGLLKAYPVRVIKAGMLGSAAIVAVLAEVLAHSPGLRLVLDPVVRASSGRPLLDGRGVDCLLKHLLGHTYLITPNLPELALLTSRDGLLSGAEEREAAHQLIDGGCQAVLVKGGHRPGPQVIDRLFTRTEETVYASSRVETSHTHGTGCTLASLIAAGLALGHPLEASVHTAKRRLSASLENHKGRSWPGQGPAFP